VALVIGGVGLAEEYKNAKIIKADASGETTIQATVKGKTVTAKIWPYVKMKCMDAKGKKIAPAAAFKEGNTVDVVTSKKIVRGKEVTTKITVKSTGG
jgi:hypothetical protein